MQIEVQLIGEEEVQSSFGLFRETVFKPLEEVFDIAFSGKRVHRVERRFFSYAVYLGDDPVSFRG